MYTLISIIHILVCLFLIAVVLLQAGKGAGMGAAFGGSSQTVFGASGGSFLGKLTAGTAIVFMITSVVLAYLSSSTGSVVDLNQPEPAAAEQVAPAAEPVPAAQAPAPETQPATGEQPSTATETAPAPAGGEAATQPVQ